MEVIEAEHHQRARARLGSWLCGKWRLDRILGAGGMATVFLATHRNGRRVAVKLLHPEVALLTEARRRFVLEGYVANRIDHPGVVAVLDDDRDQDGVPFLVMEMLDGESLEHSREAHGGVLSPAEVLGLADQVLDVLASAHDKGIIHRDIKPENLFLTREGQVKVLDFGASAVLSVLLVRSRPSETSALATPPFATASTMAEPPGPPLDASIALSAAPAPPSVTPSAPLVGASAAAVSPAPPPARSARPAAQRPSARPAPPVASDDPMDRRHRSGAPSSRRRARYFVVRNTAPSGSKLVQYT